MALSEISEKWPTIFNLASAIPFIDLTKSARYRVGQKNSHSVTLGMTPEPFPIQEGYFVATPEQLASLIVPKIEVNGDIRGFQREKVNAHARKIARALIEGEEMPPLIISIFPDGKAYIDDGQHRALAGVIARKPLEVIVKRRTVEQARRLFANQGRAKNLRSDDTLLTGDSPLELYIQDAVTSVVGGHPWSDLVAPGKSDRKMTPTTMAIAVGAYAYNTLNQGVNFYINRREDEFDSKYADMLAELIRCFGNKTTNELAFRGRTIRSISYAAIYVFRRNPNLEPGDFARWQRHMPQFDFGKYPHLLNKESEMALALVNHWNKRLPERRRVTPFHFR